MARWVLDAASSDPAPDVYLLGVISGAYFVKTV